MLSSLLNSFHQLKLHTDYPPSKKKLYLISNHIPVLLKTMLRNMFFIKYPIKDQVVNLIYAKKKNISLKNQCNKYQKKKFQSKNLQ